MSCFIKKVYSPSQHLVYLASLPQGYKGQFRTWDQEPGVGVLLWGADERAKGGELLRSVGVQISDGQVSDN